MKLNKMKNASEMHLEGCHMAGNRHIGKSNLLSRKKHKVRRTAQRWAAGFPDHNQQLHAEEGANGRLPWRHGELQPANERRPPSRPHPTHGRFQQPQAEGTASQPEKRDR